VPDLAYVCKVYPRFSETFITSEILAHEAAGLELEIVSLRPPVDGRFHPALAEVRAPVTYLPATGIRATDLWDELRAAATELPGLGAHLEELLCVDVRDAYQAVTLARHVRAGGIRHLHAHFASVATTVARLAARLAGVTYSFTAHAKDIFHESVEEADLRAKLADAVGVVTVSDFNELHLRQRFGAAADRIQRIYNGLDLSGFPYTSPADRPPVIVAVGRLVEKKGFDVLIDACAELRRRGRDFLCVIAGGGEQAAALAARVESRALGGVVSLCGPLPQHRVRELVGGAAVMAAPCVVAEDGNRDGLPTVLLEAMALGTPCVSTDVTGIPELVRHGQTGLLVGQSDAIALAEALERLLGDPAERVRLATAARALIEAEFDVIRQAAAVRRLFPPTVRGETATAAAAPTAVLAGAQGAAR